MTERSNNQPWGVVEKKGDDCGVVLLHNNEQVLVDYTTRAAGGHDNTTTAIKTNGRCTSGASNGGARGDP